MLSSQVAKACLDELKSITGIDLVLTDISGNTVALTDPGKDFPKNDLEIFVRSDAENQAMGGYHYFKVYHEDEPAYIVVSLDEGQNIMVARIAVSQLQALLVAYQERLDKDSFFQNLILDNLLLVDIYNRAKKLRVEFNKKRAVILVEPEGGAEDGATEMLKNMFAPQSGDIVTSVDKQSIIVIKQLDADEGDEKLAETANMILSMLNSEIMINAQVAYGTIVNELKEVSRSYKEAKMAVDVGKIFYADKDVVAYSTLGIGRLIYQLPINLCQMFIEEIFGGEIPDELDEEILNTVNVFLENNLNVSETARQIYVHRNTLLYRLEKLEKITGLDIRKFDDALTLKIALMVVNYMKYLETMEY
ncbi:MAG: helix-turn-helix domain-containing protein [Lachnospiraceae bacterium]|nr:helix-turn-helix domain-containing protein [Lachnospiraceae bacterium]